MRHIGILGCGGIVPAHLKAARLHRRARVVHMSYHRHRGAAEKLAADFGIERLSDDPDAVVDDPEVDTIVCALPTHLHRRCLIRAARAGKDILTEKPLCRTVTEGRRVIRACDRGGVRMAVGYVRRFWPSHAKVRQLVQTGRIGRPVTWTISHFHERMDFYRGPNNWMWDLDKGGGLVMDGSIHDFDFASWVLGPPQEMYAQSERICSSVTAPTQASAIIRFKDGDRLVYNVAWPEGNLGSGGAPNSIVGPRGTIVLDSDSQLTCHFAPGRKRVLRWGTDKLRPKAAPFDWLFYKQLDSFIRGKEDSRRATGEEALSSLWISEKIVAAGPRGRKFLFQPR